MNMDMEGMDLALPFHGTAEIDLIYFAGKLSFEIYKIGQWSELLDRANIAGLVILLGAGGVVAYCIHSSYTQMLPVNKDQERISWMSRESGLKWIFENDEASGDIHDSSFYKFLKSYNFGVLLPQANESSTHIKISTKIYFDDISLNSLTENPNPQKFLNHPLYTRDKIEKKTEKLYNNCLKGSHRNNCDNHLKTRLTSNPPCDKRLQHNHRLKTPEDKLILQRSVASNRLSVKFYKPGSDLRMEGDGSENRDNYAECESLNNYGFSKHQYRPSENLFKKSFRNRSPDVIYSDWACKSKTQVVEIDELNSACDRRNARDELVKNAKDLRRLIRETSLDSKTSDLSIGINIQFDEDLVISCPDLDSLEDSPTPPIDTEDAEDTLEKKGISNKYLWRIPDEFAERESSELSIECNLNEKSCDGGLNELPTTIHYKAFSDPSSNDRDLEDAADDVSSCVGSESDPWEWDDECYYGLNILTPRPDQDQSEQNTQNTETQHQSWLPDVCQELDLEAELAGREIYPSINYCERRFSLEREFIGSKLSLSSNTSDDMTMIGPTQTTHPGPCRPTSEWSNLV